MAVSSDVARPNIVMHIWTGGVRSIPVCIVMYACYKRPAVAEATVQSLSKWSPYHISYVARCHTQHRLLGTLDTCA